MPLREERASGEGHTCERKTHPPFDIRTPRSNGHLLGLALPSDEVHETLLAAREREGKGEEEGVWGLWRAGAALARLAGGDERPLSPAAARTPESFVLLLQD